MKQVLITGSSGVIGSVLKEGLPHDITHYDFPDFNVLDYDQLVEHAKGHDVIIHLAWDNRTAFWGSGNVNPDNIIQALNIYKAATELGIKRVIIASSVHADKFTNRELDSLLKPYELPLPDSPYGASKCAIESLGRYYADNKGLEVICLRFGGVNAKNEPPTEPYSERQVWFSHKDCIDLVTRCVEAADIPDNYVILYGMSDNKDRLHDLSNPFGWQPQDGAK